MKKKLLLFVAIVMATISLTSCGCENTAELDTLRQQVTELEERISKLENQSVVQDISISNEDTTEIETPVEQNVSDKEILEYLDTQLLSTNPDMWLEVASCEYATEQHLLDVASKAATIDYYYYSSDNKEAAISIATALSENPNVTNEVWQTLANSQFIDVIKIAHQSVKKSNSDTAMLSFLDVELSSSHPDIWLEIASCEYATEQHLLDVASKAATIDYYYYSSDNKEAAISIATAISENPNTTDNVMKALLESQYPDVWMIVANSQKSGESALTAVVENIINIKDYYYYSSDALEAAISIATAISENPNTTDNVMKALLESQYPDVWMIVANSQKSGESALTAVAEKTINLDYYYYSSDNREAAVKIATAISENPNVTNNVLKVLATSKFSEVISIGHQSIEQTK